MSQENVESHQRGVDAFNRRDLDAFLAIAATEVEFRSRLLAVEGGSYHGHDGARLWWESLLAAFPDFQIEALDVRGAGDYTIAKIHNRGHGEGSDAPFEEVRWQVARWRDGKLASWQVYDSEAEALEAAGLAEYAMSQENVETLRGGFDAFARGDVDGVLERLDPDVDWSPAIGPILGVETVRGREALRRFLTRDLFEGFDQFGAEPLSIEDLGGEYVLVMVRYTGRGQSSGIEMDQTFASLYRMRDGKVVTMRDYPTRTEALEAAGLAG